MKTAAATNRSRLWKYRLGSNYSIEVFPGYHSYQRPTCYGQELLITKGSCTYSSSSCCCSCCYCTNSNRTGTNVFCGSTASRKYYHSTPRILEPETSGRNKKKTTLIPKQEKDDISLEEYTKAVSELSKARLSGLVVSTCTFGYLAAAVEPISYTTLAAASLGTALCSSSASTLNQIFEQDRDARMKRTAHRPLVTKRIFDTNGAYALAAGSGLSGGATLYFGTDPVTTALGVGNILLYAGAYTFMKPRSEWNTWVGAIVGAIPPVMGYTAATDGMGIWDIEAALLGGTLFLWQFPHFFALSWMHRVDYARGGFQVRNESGLLSTLLIVVFVSVHTCDRTSSVPSILGQGDPFY